MRSACRPTAKAGDVIVTQEDHRLADINYHTAKLYVRLNKIFSFAKIRIKCCRIAD